ncbi:hypothetical protein V6N13_014380 [Hibiscus sabdariffa]
MKAHNPFGRSLCLPEGKHRLPNSCLILHLKGDRQGFEVVKSSLSAEGYDVVYDINGREAVEVEPILDALPNLEQWPGDRLMQSIGRVGTSLNYNPVEEWFFHRLKAGRPIPIPNSGVQITQLGHVKDLATAFVQVLGNEKASKQVFNISGEKLVDFLNPKEFDIGKKKAFPFRNQHFFASVEKAKHVLGWRPEFDLVEGLTDSYNLDFGRGTYRKEADFSTDDMILNKSFALQS